MKINSVNIFDTKLFNEVDDSQYLEWNRHKIFNQYKKYCLNGYYKDVNDSLRTNSPVNLQTYDIIQGMDKIFETMPAKHLSNKPEVVYRGISDDIPKSLVDILTLKDKTQNTFVDRAFVSTSTDKLTAKQFRENKNGYILRITLPPKTKRINSTLLPGDMAGALSTENEVTLPRNSKFRVDSFDLKTNTVDLTYLGQELPLPTLEIESKKKRPFDDELLSKSNCVMFKNKY